MKKNRPLDLEPLIQATASLARERFPSKQVCIRSAKDAANFLYQRFANPLYSKQELLLNYRTLRNLFGVGQGIPDESSVEVLAEFLGDNLKISTIDDLYRDTHVSYLRRLKNAHDLLRGTDAWNHCSDRLAGVRTEIPQVMQDIVEVSHADRLSFSAQERLTMARTASAALDFAWSFDLSDKSIRLANLFVAAHTILGWVKLDGDVVQSCLIEGQLFGSPANAWEIYSNPDLGVDHAKISTTLHNIELALELLNRVKGEAVRMGTTAEDWVGLMRRFSARLLLQCRETTMAERGLIECLKNCHPSDRFGMAHIHAFWSQLEEKRGRIKAAIQQSRLQEDILTSIYGDALHHSLGAVRMRLYLLNAGKQKRQRYEYAQESLRRMAIDYTDTLSMKSVVTAFPDIRRGWKLL